MGEEEGSSLNEKVSKGVEVLAKLNLETLKIETWIIKLKTMVESIHNRLELVEENCLRWKIRLSHYYILILVKENICEQD